MPVIKSAKKRMRQNIKRRAQNYPVRTELKTFVKKVLQMVKDGKIDEAEKTLPKANSIIDTAVKKKIIHQNNGNRKKSRLAKAINAAKGGGSTSKATVDVTEEKKEKTSK